MPSCGSSIHWFRKGLRLHDNPSLLAAIDKYKGEHLELRPVFVLDPWFVKNGRVGPNRWRFLMESLQDLDDQLRKLGSRLFVVRGQPENVFPKLFEKWNVKRLTFEVDTEPYAKDRDSKISDLAKGNNIEVIAKVSHTLYDTKAIVAANKGSAPLTYQKLQSVISSMGPPLKPAATLEELPSPCKITNGMMSEQYNVPDLKELGVKESVLGECLYRGGETEGLRRLENKLKNESWVRGFEKPKTAPNSLKPSTTVLSPYLKFGCVSPRTFYWRLHSINSRGKHSQPPVSLVGQLLWREFFYTCGDAIENFDRMEGNAICRQIPWGNNPAHLAAWKEGRTGFPFIDAIMTQLRQEGWIHHLARHAVACFLTRGDLWVSWEEGMKIFEEYLLDADWSLNAANWMWLSASAFFHQFFRVYSPVAFGKKTDPNGDYIKKYLPQFKKYPSKYIYEPWNAPLSVQNAAGCVIGKDYPRPIVDHAEASKANMAKMKAAYAKGKVATMDKPKAEVEPPKKKVKKAENITNYLKKV